ncbi:hypothetical protein [Actinoplanes xinjiangensis]|uniref:Lipoprotein n=1 Tax=Actinoplanes xinjiangensis TaxID=512350 RepID=A0A316FFP2_9ACTN|nr:hypothetical protein [Actinoplanes xinjiangensis]PWK47123.1 hypothetical protein BC793_108238 [Actinoplanes xinjiangensis]GIF40281.1 hypothetical protein Axi01nite_45920 [Actinoplanes xinjiangensis]
MRRLLPFAAGLLLLTGCSGEPATPQAAVCESYAAVQNTVEHIRQTNVSENGLTALKPYLTQLLDHLEQFVADAKAQFGPEADTLRAAVGQLSASVDVAREDPDLTNLAAVRGDVADVRTGAQSLRAGLQELC